MDRRFWLACAAGIVLACSSSSSTGGSSGPTSDAADETSNGADSATDDVVADTPDPYPSGPYGTKVGDVLADVQLLGYTHFDPATLASTVDYAPTSLADLRNAAPVKYGVLHVGEFW